MHSIPRIVRAPNLVIGFDMTDREIPVRISICVDCLMLLANGEVFDSEGNDISDSHAREIEREWPGIEITLGRVQEWDESDEDFEAGQEYESEGWFSWYRCQGCGSRLGGQRYYATAWVREH